jgi:hypothetical protein
MARDAQLAQTQPDRPVLELACSTWMAFDRFYNEHIRPCRMFLPPAMAPSAGPVQVNVKLPSGEVLRFDGVVGRVHSDAAGNPVGTELRFESLSHEEQRELSRYAARRERGWSVPPMPRVSSDRAPASGLHIKNKE